VDHRRIERIWREEGLQVPKKIKKRRRLWLNDGSCIRLRREYKNHVWTYEPPVPEAWLVRMASGLTM